MRSFKNTAAHPLNMITLRCSVCKESPEVPYESAFASLDFDATCSNRDSSFCANEGLRVGWRGGIGPKTEHKQVLKTGSPLEL